MANPLNNGTLTGRVSQDIKEFPNSDGSKVLLATIAVDNNFVSGADKTAKTQFVPVRAFLPKSVSGRGSWDRVHKGDLISIQTRISCEPYQKNGETVYPAPTIEVDGYPQFLESKATTEARAARNAVAEQEAAAAATPAAAPVVETTVTSGETAEQTIARLEAQLAAQGAQVPNYDETSPFAGV